MHFTLRKITLTNFRGVRGPLVLDFTNLRAGLYYVRGVNEVEPTLGSNRAGKSTLFIDAVMWVMRNIIARSKRPAEAVEHWDAGKETTSGIVEFGIDDDIHIIERWRKPNNLLLNGRKVEQRDVDDLIPLSDGALRRSLFIDQFGSMFLSLDREEKSRIFSETLDLDKWIDAADIAGEAARTLERELQGIDRAVESNASALAEARSQLVLARQSDDAFEAGIKALLKPANASYKAAKSVYEQREAELDAARAAHSKFGHLDTMKTVVNDLQVKKRRQESSVGRSGRFSRSFATGDQVSRRADRDLP